MATARLLDIGGVEISNENSAFKNTDDVAHILDKDWAKNAFLVEGSSLKTIDKVNRTFSSAFFKFTDTSLGGALCINPKPQYTRYSDIRVKGRMPDRQDVTVNHDYTKASFGMGRYYSEAIDDNNQVIYLRFGVASFNSLTQFFTGFYNSGQARLAKTGRYDTAFFQDVGFIAGAALQIFFWPLAVIHVTGMAVNWLFGHNSSKFYTMKPTMFPYWGAVNNIVNRIAVNKGLFPVTIHQDSDKIGSNYNLDPTEMEQLHNMMPDIFSAKGYYDVYQVANKAQRIKTQLDLYLYKNFDEASETDFTGTRQRVGQDTVNSPDGAHTVGNNLNNFFSTPAYYLSAYSNKSTDLAMNSLSEINKVRNGRTFEDAVKGWIDSSEGRKDQTATETSGATTDGTDKLPDVERSWSTTKSEDPSFFQGLINNSIAEMQDGSQFAAFRVDYTGSVSESFSNSVGESEIAGKLNGASATGRDANFNFGGVMEDLKNMPIVSQIISATADVAKGVLDSFSMSGLLALAGGSFVDIPKHWQSSSASLPRASYTIHLGSPYGNPISQINNIYIPLAMLLAGALPLSTGKQSYTSPFLCELYDKGRCQTRLGMIDSLSITRGTSNLGFDKKGKPLAIDVSFSIVDMSSIMHMQLSSDKLFGQENSMFDEETVFSDYLAVLAGLNASDQLYMIPKLKRQLANKVNNLKQLSSPGMWAMRIHENTPVGLLDVFYKGRGGLDK